MMIIIIIGGGGGGEQWIKMIDGDRINKKNKKKNIFPTRLSDGTADVNKGLKPAPLNTCRLKPLRQVTRSVIVGILMSVQYTYYIPGLISSADSFQLSFYFNF